MSVNLIASIGVLVLIGIASIFFYLRDDGKPAGSSLPTPTPIVTPKASPSISPSPQASQSATPFISTTPVSPSPQASSSPTIGN